MFIRHVIRLALSLSLVAFIATAAAGPIQLSEAAGGLKAENDFWRLSIDPARGGAVRSFVYKKLEPQNEWIYPLGGGLLEDMIWQQRHPGELQNEKYEYTIRTNTPEQAVVELWRAFKNEPYPGLVLRKVVTLSANSAAINVETVLENPTSQQVFPGLWIQNRMWPGGNPDAVPVATRPSYLGIRTSVWENNRLTGSDFIRKPAAPWSVIFDRTTKAGLLVLTDFNYLQQFYNCLSQNTMETFYDRVLIKPGGKWSVRYTLLPLKDVENCFYADRRLFATGSSKGDALTFAFRPVDAPVPAATVAVAARKSDKTATLAEQSFALTNITADTPASVTLHVPGSSKEPVIITLRVDAGEGPTVFEFMHYADRTFYSLQDSAITYRATIPKKEKPELMENREVSLQKGDRLRVLHAVGVWADMNRISEAVKALDPKVEVRDTFFRSSVIGPELSWQPILVDDLLGYDLVVLNNVGADCLGEAGEIAVAQYVKAGGRLLICGGLFSLGNSRWDESVLAAVTPIETAGPFDVMPFDAFLKIVNTASPSADLGTVQWYQAAKSVRPGAEVQATAAGKPILVTWKCGKGAVMVQLATPMGKPAAGATPYWNSPGWAAFMKAELATLLGWER